MKTLKVRIKGNPDDLSAMEQETLVQLLAKAGFTDVAAHGGTGDFVLELGGPGIEALPLGVDPIDSGGPEQVIEGCLIQWDKRRGVVYVHSALGKTLVRVQGLAAARNDVDLTTSTPIDVKTDEKHSSTPIG